MSRDHKSRVEMEFRTISCLIPHETGLGSSSLIAHVLHSPPPPLEQLCNRSCSNKTHRLHQGKGATSSARMLTCVFLHVDKRFLTCMSKKNRMSTCRNDVNTKKTCQRCSHHFSGVHIVSRCSHHFSGVHIVSHAAPFPNVEKNRFHGSCGYCI